MSVLLAMAAAAKSVPTLLDHFGVAVIVDTGWVTMEECALVRHRI